MAEAKHRDRETISLRSPLTDIIQKLYILTDLCYITSGMEQKPVCTHPRYVHGVKRYVCLTLTNRGVKPPESGPRDKSEHVTGWNLFPGCTVPYVLYIDRLPRLNHTVVLTPPFLGRCVASSSHLSSVVCTKLISCGLSGLTFEMLPTLRDSRG